LLLEGYYVNNWDDDYKKQLIAPVIEVLAVYTALGVIAPLLHQTFFNISRGATAKEMHAITH
jgi:hypothetical protein